MATPHHHSIAYDILNDALKIILKKCSTESPIDVKPYRLLTSLFDKPQIGPVILDGILYDVFRTLYLSCLHQQKHKNNSVRCVSFNGDLMSLNNDENILNKQFVSKNCQELIKNANLLFNTLQSYYIWSYIEKLYDESVKGIKNLKYRDRVQVNEIGSGMPHILEICILTDFLLDIIPIESYAESTSNILPNLFQKIICSLKSNITDLNKYEITQSLQLCTKILTKFQPLSLTQVAKSEGEQENDSMLNETFEKSLESSLILENGKLESEEQRTLEKSKSDSRINENLSNFEKNELTVEELSRERSYSNQMLKKKDKTSPRIEKKSKNKKSKSSSKLYDLKKDDNSDSLSSENATPEKQESIIKEVTETTAKTAKVENKYFLKCLEEYKKFYVCLIKNKVLPDIDIKTFFNTLICDKNDRTKQLVKLLDARLSDNPASEFLPVDIINNLTKHDILSVFSVAAESVVCEYEKSMNVGSNILLEFSAFPNLLGSNVEEKLPSWLEVLIVAACCKDSSREIQLTAMTTLLEIFSLAKNQVLTKKEESKTNIVITGILHFSHVKYIEENTIVIEVSSCLILDEVHILSYAIYKSIFTN